MAIKEVVQLYTNWKQSEASIKQASKIMVARATNDGMKCYRIACNNEVYNVIACCAQSAVESLIDTLERIDDPDVIALDEAERLYKDDLYVVGGNSSLALVHQGYWDLYEIGGE